MKKHTLAFIDTETTGLDVDQHELIEIGCVLARQEWVGGKLKLIPEKEFEVKIKPTRIQDADPIALRVNGYNETDWIFAHDLKDAMKLFSDITKDTIFISHNLAFDAGFVDKAFRQTGIPNQMHYPRLDTISIAFARMHSNDDQKYSLHALSEYFGIKNPNAHTALSDARTLCQLYEKIMHVS
ncbi:MAG: 3'-5' exonuclease [Candidatus Pacebacteria bacterium]|nr:3'-5' exonuclease [Candidatus Paceibacterota bacterium]